jgi:MoaA/NifB/PqqE/SkfB family radical SAM enzyme
MAARLRGLASRVWAVLRSKKSARATKYRGYFCARPFEFAQVSPTGELYLCCPQHLDRTVGNLLDTDLMPAWNSAGAEEIRASILDGTFKYCNEDTCGMLQERNLLTVEEAQADARYSDIVSSRTTHLDRGPITINFSYDLSCNLSCPSCRTHQIILKGDAREPVRIIHDRVVAEHLVDAQRLVITGSGDPFQSRLYLSFLRTFKAETNPDLRIQLSTNGLLLNEEMWNSICHELVDWVDVSVDGASADTYALNRGGDFQKLLANLRFIGSLRDRGQLDHFELHFVVQKNNYHEMEDFLALGREVNCDKVCFKQIVNWGTFTPDEYARRAVQLPQHPEHEQFLAVLRNPIFRADRGKVTLHDLTDLANASG